MSNATVDIILGAPSQELFVNALKAYPIVFYVVLGISILLSLMRCWFLYQLNQLKDFTREFGIAAVATVFNTFADMYTYMNVAFGFFWYLFYANCLGESNCFPNDPANFFRIMMLLCFIFKSLSIVYMLARQCSHDIFFIDWEKPKGYIQAEGVADVVMSKPGAYRHLKLCDKWNSIQTKRVTCLPFTLLIVCIFMQTTPRLAMERNHPNFDHFSRVFPRFGYISLVFVVAAIVQYFFMNYFFFHFIRDPCRDFVEECQLANISMILLPDRFHGYYVHGATVHQYADVDMFQILRNVQYEKDNRVSVRTLMPGDNCVSFEIFIKQAVRDEYDTVYIAVIDKLDVGLPMVEGTQMNPLLLKTRAFDVLTRFFCTWIDKLAVTHQIQIEDRGMVQRALEMPPDMINTAHSVFYRDQRDNMFRAVTLGGLEMELLVFELLTFAFFDYCTHNYSIVAAFLTFTLSKVLEFARGYMGRNNISRKTLTDKCLL